MSPTKILRNPERWGGLGVVTEPARCRPLGVQCHFCRNEVHYSLTTFHSGHPEISCPGCKRTGYMVRGEQPGGQLIWFRDPDLNGTSDAPHNH